MNVVKLPLREQRILVRLQRLFARRDAQAARLADTDAQISAETKALAKERRVIFIRTDTVRREVESRAA